MLKIIDAKIFVLSPDSQSRKRIETVISKEKSEVYILENHTIIKPLLMQYDKNILVIDIDNSQLTRDLNDYVLDIITSVQNKLIKIIIVGDCGQFIKNEKVLYLDRSEIIRDENILSIIDDLNIWGQRNFIRFGSHISRIAYFRMKFKESWRTGVIHDISASGMSCSFDKYSEINLDENSTSIEICIKEKIFSLSGSFLIRRTFKNSNMFVIVFSRKRSSENIKSLNSIIYNLSREDVLDNVRKLV